MKEAEAAPLIEKNYRWNFTVNVLDGGRASGATVAGR